MTTNDDDVATSAAATAAEDDATNDDITFDEIYNSLPSLRASLKMKNELTSSSSTITTPALPRCRSPDREGLGSRVAVSGRGRGGRGGRGGGRGDDRRGGKTKSSSSKSSSSSSNSSSGGSSSSSKLNVVVGRC